MRNDLERYCDGISRRSLLQVGMGGLCGLTLLGIDPATTFVDNSGRPRYLLEHREPIHELA